MMRAWHLQEYRRGRGPGSRTGGALLAGLMLSVAATALAAPAAQARDEDAPALRREVEVRLAPQPLSSALLQLSRQTGLAVVAARDLTAGHQAPAIEGRMTPLEALRYMLSGTDLDFKVVGQGTVSIVPKRERRAGVVKTSWLADPAARPDPALLQQAKAPQSAPATPEFTMEEIVVTARRREESLLSVPISVSAFSGQQLEDLGAVDLTDINLFVPNVTIEVSRGTNTTLTAFIRGVGQQDPVAGFEQGVGIYIDDVYLNRPQGAVLDLYDVERIEVLRGPQGTLYGRNTIGGAVKYVTRRLGEEPSAEIRLTGGNYRQFDAVGTFTLPLTDTFRMGGAVARFTRNGFGRNLNLVGLENYDKDILGGRLSFEWTPDPDVFVRIAGDWTDDNSDPRQGHRLIPGLFSGAPVLKNVFDTRAGLNTPQADTVNRGISGLIEWTIDERFTLKNILAYRDNRSDQPLDFDSLPVVDVDVPVTYKDHQVTEELQLLFQSGKWSGVAGFFYMNASAFNVFDVVLGELGDLIGLPGLNAFTFGRVKTDTWALFFDATYALTPEIDISYGGRFTSDRRKAEIRRQTFLGGFSPFFGGPERSPILTATDFTGAKTFEKYTSRGSVSWHPNDDHNFYVSVSQGFKGGGFDPRGSATAAPDLDGDGIAGAADPEDVFQFLLFKPERIISYEVGHKGRFADGRFRHSLAAFWSPYKDVQIPGSVGVDTNGDGVNDTFIGVTTNAARARIRGIEWEADALLLPDAFAPGGEIRLNWSLGYIDADYKQFINAFGQDISDVARFQNTPRWTASVGLVAAAPLTILGAQGRLQFLPRVAYRSLTHQFEVDSAFLDQPEYALVDISLVWTSDDGRWELGVHGRNLTDKRYIIAGWDFIDDATGAPTLGLEGVATAFYGNPRTVSGTVKLRF
ncbi:MAG: TonB-dependent receptor [Rhodothalassiaceae bacterium]|nr:MAG: TonB-dependent receptor [Rhodothalassiaceae bacterium]